MGPGQPPLFKTPEDLQSKIDEYFENCKGKIIPPEEPDGEPTIIYGEPVTITGLALYLGFESRQSLYDYEKRSEFSYIIKRSRLIVECEYEKRLQSKNPTGNIFALKNMGWKDTQEITADINSNVKFSGIEVVKPNEVPPQSDSQTV